MAIQLDGEFQANFEKIKEEEKKKIKSAEKVEVGFHFEKNQLSSLSFNLITSPWGDNYWIVFPNPEKIEWKDVRQAVSAGLNYMATKGVPGDMLGMLD